MKYNEIVFEDIDFRDANSRLTKAGYKKIGKGEAGGKGFSNIYYRNIQDLAYINSNCINYFN